jgi:glutamine synthetase
MATELEAAVGSGVDLNVAIQTLLEQIMTLHGSVIFNGDGYSDEWQIEAESRGLPNLRTTVDALPQLATDEAKELFSRYGVLNNRELQSRLDVSFEHYVLSVGVEARSTLEIAKTIVFPTAMRYQTELAANGASLAVVGYEFDKGVLDEMCGLIADLKDAIAVLEPALEHDHAASLADEARFFCDVVVPATLAVRAAGDRLEAIVADDLWPLASYQEMLFIL